MPASQVKSTAWSVLTPLRYGTQEGLAFVRWPWLAVQAGPAFFLPYHFIASAASALSCRFLGLATA